ncbi:MAG: glycosyltransferase family A protein [Bryobacteraceae bacterium]
MTPPRFSVVIPAFNAEQFLPCAIRSVLAQTDPRLELIVVDDGSTDKTVSVACGFGDPRLRVLSRSNSGGPAAPRNEGILASQGEYVAFLDADDWWVPQKLAAFDAAIRSNPAAGLYFSNGFVTDAFGHVRHWILPPSTRELPVRVSDERLALLNYIPLSSAVVRRSLLSDHSFDEQAALHGVEDYLLWLDLNRRHPFHFVGSALFYKRQHSANLSADAHHQRERLRILIDTLESWSAYPPDLIALSRTLNEVRYPSGPLRRAASLLVIAKAAIAHPLRTPRRLLGVARLRNPAPERNRVAAEPTRSRAAELGTSLGV